MAVIVHAGLVARRRGGRWQGVLIEGPSGSGKSDLALRLVDQGFRLVADDRTILWTSGGRLFGRAPDSLSGLMESREIGVLREAWVAFAEVAMVAACAGPGTALERTPEPQTVEKLGLRLPHHHIHALEGSAPAKLRRALERLGSEAGHA